MTLVMIDEMDALLQRSSGGQVTVLCPFQPIGEAGVIFPPKLTDLYYLSSPVNVANALLVRSRVTLGLKSHAPPRPSSHCKQNDVHLTALLARTRAVSKKQVCTRRAFKWRGA